MMMEHLAERVALPDFDVLDVDLDGIGGFELESNDFDTLLGVEGEGLDNFSMNDDDMDNLMKEGLPGESGMAYSDHVDHLKIMPIAEIDQADVILGLGPAKETQEFQPKPLEARSVPQWNQPVQPNDPLLGNLRRDAVPLSDSIQMIVDQGFQNGAHGHNGMLPPMGQNNHVSVADLNFEKQKLLDRLQEINMREEHTSNDFQQQMHTSNGFQQQQQQQMRPNNGFVFQRNEHIPQAAPSSNNVFLQEPTPFAPPVASVGGLGGGGETPLQSFLRAGRKSQNPAGQPSRPTVSLLSQNVAGAPKAASVFSQLPSDLEAITSQSELQASNSFLDQGDSKTPLFASMDRSIMSQEMVRKMSSRSLARQNSGRKVSGTVGNASWGIDPSRKSGFRTSGILSKHASESHLVRKGGLALSKSKTGSISRENALYSLMKRNSSKNLLRREDSQGSLLASKRRGGSKHKLSLSSSVPALMANNLGSVPQGSRNAMW
jgi:hypothetical protein